MQLAATIDFNPDRGQNFGTIFEARDRDGRLVAGAGFAGLYNSRFRRDRRTLQFFIRPRTFQCALEAPPRPTADHGCSMCGALGGQRKP